MQAGDVFSLWRWWIACSLSTWVGIWREDMAWWDVNQSVCHLNVLVWPPPPTHPRPLRRAVILWMHLKRALSQCQNVHEQILVNAAQHGGLHIRRLSSFSSSVTNKRGNIWNAEVLLCRLIYAVTFIMSCETTSLGDRMHSCSNQAEMWVAGEGWGLGSDSDTCLDFFLFIFCLLTIEGRISGEITTTM